MCLIDICQEKQRLSHPLLHCPCYHAQAQQHLPYIMNGNLVPSFMALLHLFRINRPATQMIMTQIINRHSIKMSLLEVHFHASSKNEREN